MIVSVSLYAKPTLDEVYLLLDRGRRPAHGAADATARSNICSEAANLRIEQSFGSSGVLAADCGRSKRAAAPWAPRTRCGDRTCSERPSEVHFSILTSTTTLAATAVSEFAVSAVHNGTMSSPALAVQGQRRLFKRTAHRAPTTASRCGCNDAGMRALLAAASAIVSIGGIVGPECELSGTDMPDAELCETHAPRVSTQAAGHLSGQSSWDGRRAALHVPQDPSLSPG